MFLASSASLRSIICFCMAFPLTSAASISALVSGAGNVVGSFGPIVLLGAGFGAGIGLLTKGLPLTFERGEIAEFEPDATGVN